MDTDGLHSYATQMPVPNLDLKQTILAAMRQEPLPTSQSGVPQHLQEVTLEECRKLVVGYLQKKTSEVLSFMSGRFPESQQSLNDLGFTSMMAMELRYGIETELEMSIPVAVFTGTSTLAQVARFLFDQLLLTSVMQSESLSTGPDDDSDEVTL